MLKLEWLHEIMLVLNVADPEIAAFVRDIARESQVSRVMIVWRWRRLKKRSRGEALPNARVRGPAWSLRPTSTGSAPSCKPEATPTRIPSRSCGTCSGPCGSSARHDDLLVMVAMRAGRTAR